MANAEDLVIAKKTKCNFAMREAEDAIDLETRYATRLPIDGERKNYLKSQTKLERSINEIRRYQRRLGFQSDAHAEKGVAKFWKNLN